MADEFTRELAHPLSQQDTAFMRKYQEGLGTPVGKLGSMTIRKTAALIVQRTEKLAEERDQSALRTGLGLTAGNMVLPIVGGAYGATMARGEDLDDIEFGEHVRRQLGGAAGGLGGVALGALGSSVAFDPLSRRNPGLAGLLAGGSTLASGVLGSGAGYNAVARGKNEE